MLKITPPDYKFCPFCGKSLEIKIEEEQERKYCSSCNWTYYPHVAAAAGGVIIKEGKVLMVKRNREPYKGTWMFPAGFISYGELPADTVVREVKEETGLEVQVGKFLELVQVDDDFRESGHFMLFYEAFVLEGDLKNDEEENAETAWVDIKNHPPIGWNGHKLVMKKLQEGKY